MNFVKVETNGNDFIIIENNNPQNVDIVKICDRHFGVGCDQIIFLNGNIVQFFNQDGTIANMCGNGLAAVAAYSKKTLFQIQDKQYKCSVNNNLISVNLDINNIEIYEKYAIVDVGNKHIVFFDKNLLYEQYIKDYNVHYTYKIDKNTIKITTYERGAGKTLACGSGAVAVAAAFGMPKTTIIHDGGKSLVVLSGNTATLTVMPKILFSGIL